MSLNLNGVVAASVVPFQKDHSIDEAGFRKNIRFLLGHGEIYGILVNGLAGEVTSLERGERAALVRWTKAEINRACALVSGISAQSTREAVETAKEAEQAGADALLVTAPSLFARGGASDPEAPLRFFEAISQAVEIPVLVFQHQVSSGLCYPEKTLMRICEIPNVIGMKSTVWDQERYEREWSALKAMPRPPLVLSGNDTLLLSNFAVGCDGAILGIANLLPRSILDLYSHMKSGRLIQAQEVYSRILPLLHAIYRPPAFDYYSRMKEAMVMLGILNTAVVRPPLVAASDEERTRIREALKAAKLL
jgi:4-hydroxy-tetrahydrodipicolinate synthase